MKDNGNIFTIDDLVRWNSDKLTSSATTLQIGWKLFTFNEEYIDMLINEMGIMALALPKLAKLSDYSYAKPNEPSLNFINELVIPGLEPPKTTTTVKPTTPQSPKPSTINTKTWQSILEFGGSWVVRAGLVVSFVILPTPAGSPTPLRSIYFNPDVENMSNDGKNLTFCSYTKTNSNEINGRRPQDFNDLKNGKVYIGRTAGYNKNPRMIVSIRDVRHHKTERGYESAYLDRFENTHEKKDRRHNANAYKLIRGREQVVMENLGEAWSEMFTKYPGSRELANMDVLTRSGNAINGIDKSKAVYNIYTQMARGKYGIVPITWDGAYPYY